MPSAPLHGSVGMSWRSARCGEAEVNGGGLRSCASYFKTRPEASLSSDKAGNHDSALRATTTHARLRADVFTPTCACSQPEAVFKDKCAGTDHRTTGLSFASLRTELSAYAESFRVGRHGSGRSESSSRFLQSPLSFKLHSAPNVLLKIIDPSKLPAYEESMQSVRMLKKLPSIVNILVILISIVIMFFLTFTSDETH